MSDINRTNQLDCRYFHPVVLGRKVGKGLGRILCDPMKINCGYLVEPMVEPYNAV